MNHQVTEASIFQSVSGGGRGDLTESMHKSLHCCKKPWTRVVSPGMPTTACTRTDEQIQVTRLLLSLLVADFLYTFYW